jgi:hypothetical protein
MIKEKVRGRKNECICPKCQYTVPKEPEITCRDRKCPKCGTNMLSKRS